jgi:hypothetical protein
MELGREGVISPLLFLEQRNRHADDRRGLVADAPVRVLQHLPSAICDAFPERWEVFRLIGEDDYPWKWEELSTALRKLVLDVGRGQNFFMMIDGLDECAGGQSRLTDLILDVINLATNIKACVAGRPAMGQL